MSEYPEVLGKDDKSGQKVELKAGLKAGSKATAGAEPEATAGTEAKAETNPLSPVRGDKLTSAADGYVIERFRWWHIDEVLPIEEDLFGAEKWSPAMFWNELATRQFYLVALGPMHEGDPTHGIGPAREGGAGEETGTGGTVAEDVVARDGSPGDGVAHAGLPGAGAAPGDGALRDGSPGEGVSRIDLPGAGAAPGDGVPRDGSPGDGVLRAGLVGGVPGRVVGYAGLSVVDEHESWVQNIAVRRDAQRLGIGRGLLEALLAEAARRGARKTLLEVAVDNAPAQRLYATYGFEPVGIRRGYYQPSNTDALVMMRDA